MFHPLAYDETHDTVLARFSGALTEQDLIDCDLASGRRMIIHGPSAALLDFSRVDTVEVTTAQFILRGKQPQIWKGQRRAMVANGMLFGLLRMFGVYQSEHSLEPMIVRTLAEAYETLGVTVRDFHPVELPAANAPPRFDGRSAYIA